MTTFTPRGRANLAAFMAVDSNPQSADYGTIRILQLPQDTAIRGPGQVQNDFESNSRVASQLTLLRQGGSKVTLGNLITLPVGGGLMYFEPVYVSQSAAGNGGSYPTLQQVLVYYNGQVGFSPTLTGALAQALGVSAATAPSSPSGASTGPAATSAVLRYLRQAQSLYTAAQADLRSGDFAAYGRDIAKMKAALDNASMAAQGSTAASGGANACVAIAIGLAIAVCSREPVAPASVIPPREPAGTARLSAGKPRPSGPFPFRPGHGAEAEGVRSDLTGNPEQKLASDSPVTPQQGFVKGA